MALNFPNSPTDGQIYSDTQTGNRWVWDNANTCWKSTSTYAQTVTVSSTQPGSPTVGQLWWSQDYGRLFVYYNDGDSTQWVEANPADQTAGLVFNTANAAYGVANTALQNTSGTFAGNLTVTGNTTINKKTVITYAPSTADNSAVHITAANTQGGVGYADFMTVKNNSHPGVTNGSKTFRLNSAGGLEVINSAYSSMIFSISNEGIVTKPYQPAFQGSGRVGGDLNTGSESTFTIWVSATAITNRGSCWNSGTGRFTCPVAGVYYVAAFFLCRSNGSHNVHLYKNGSQTGVKGRDIATAGEQNTGLIGYVDCAVNDILDIRVSNGGGDFYNDFNYIAISFYG